MSITAFRHTTLPGRVVFGRATLAHLAEEVARLGIERVSDLRNGQRDSPQAVPIGPNKLTALQ